MSSRSIGLDDRLHRYLCDVTVRETPVMRELREETARHPLARMQISPEQGQFLTLLVDLIGARRTLEVGVFTGYSALAVARALPHDGRILACDVSEEFTAIARAAWARAGEAGKIDLRLAPATQTLSAAIAAGEAGTYDFAFIDADKASYDAYYEASLTLLRAGGLIAVDNALWSGKVADCAEGDADTAALRALNAKVSDDARVRACLLPVGDGLLLAHKR